MRTCLAFQVVGLVGMLALSSARAEVEFSAGIQISGPSDFYQPLTPYGEWVDVGSYGRCWHPIDTASDWRPYCNGQWVWTDCGWYWESDEPWSWACYHYGSWVDDPTYGWCWIPGTEWAPAWVVWRESPEYIGWAPCGPGRTVLGPTFFGFVDIHHFHDRISRRELIVDNPTIIERTRVINDFRHETRDFDGRRERIFVNQGPGIDSIRRVTGRTFEARPITQVVTQTRIPENVRVRSDEHIEHQRLRANEALPRTGRERTRPEQQRNYQERNAQQPRNYEQPRTPAEQQRNYERPRTQPEQQRPALPPTGREQQRQFQTPPQPQQREVPRQFQTPPQPQQREVPRTQPQTPQLPRSQPETAVPRHPESPDRRAPVLPPTGREQPRQFENPVQPPVREVPRAQPATPAPQAPIAPQQRVLPPTGRERGDGVGPAARPDGGDRGQGRGRERDQ